MGEAIRTSFNANLKKVKKKLKTATVVNKSEWFSFNSFIHACSRINQNPICAIVQRTTLEIFLHTFEDKQPQSNLQRIVSSLNNFLWIFIVNLDFYMLHRLLLILSIQSNTKKFGRRHPLVAWHNMSTSPNSDTRRENICKKSNLGCRSDASLLRELS